MGDSVQVYVSGAPGTHALVPVGVTGTLIPVDAGDAGRTTADAGTTALFGVALSDTGTYTCSSQGTGTVSPLTADQFIAAVESNNCPVILASQDSRWSRNTCSGSGPGCSASPQQSGSHGPSTPTSLGILLALVTGVVARRAHRALRSPQR